MACAGTSMSTTVEAARTFRRSMHARLPASVRVAAAVLAVIACARAPLAAAVPGRSLPSYFVTPHGTCEATDAGWPARAVVPSPEDGPLQRADPGWDLDIGQAPLVQLVCPGASRENGTTIVVQSHASRWHVRVLVCAPTPAEAVAEGTEWHGRWSASGTCRTQALQPCDAPDSMPALPPGRTRSFVLPPSAQVVVFEYCGAPSPWAEPAQCFGFSAPAVESGSYAADAGVLDLLEPQLLYRCPDTRDLPDMSNASVSLPPGCACPAHFWEGSAFHGGVAELAAGALGLAIAAALATAPHAKVLDLSVEAMAWAVVDIAQLLAVLTRVADALPPELYRFCDHLRWVSFQPVWGRRDGREIVAAARAGGELPEDFLAQAHVCVLVFVAAVSVAAGVAGVGRLVGRRSETVGDANRARFAERLLLRAARLMLLPATVCVTSAAQWSQLAQATGDLGSPGLGFIPWQVVVSMLVVITLLATVARAAASARMDTRQLGAKPTVCRCGRNDDSGLLADRAGHWWPTSDVVRKACLGVLFGAVSPALVNTLDGPLVVLTLAAFVQCCATCGLAALRSRHENLQESWLAISVAAIGCGTLCACVAYVPLVAVRASAADSLDQPVHVSTAAFGPTGQSEIVLQAGSVPAAGERDSLEGAALGVASVTANAVMLYTLVALIVCAAWTGFAARGLRVACRASGASSAAPTSSAAPAGHSGARAATGGRDGRKSRARSVGRRSTVPGVSFGARASRAPRSRPGQAAAVATTNPLTAATAGAAPSESRGRGESSQARARRRSIELREWQ